MLISGIQQFTMLDFPGTTACIVFTPGCNFRCGYCHNPEFVLPENIIKIKDSFIPEASFFSFLGARRGLLGGVVVSGGEPTNAGDLVPFIQKIKNAGFKVKLDTNGNRPDVLQKILEHNLVDYVAMDYKTSQQEYRSLVGPLANPQKIATSVELLKKSAIDYEIRSTLIKEHHSDIILTSMARELAGVKKWFLQYFRPAITLDPRFATYSPFETEEMVSIVNRFQNNFDSLVIRS